MLRFVDSGITTKINCPDCGGTEVVGTVYELVYREIGITIGRELYVRCTKCGHDLMLVNLRTGDIPSLSADQLTPHIVPPATTTGAILAVSSIVLCWVPVLGFYVAWRALRKNLHTHGLSRAASLAAMCLATLITGGALAGLVTLAITFLLGPV